MNRGCECAGSWVDTKTPDEPENPVIIDLVKPVLPRVETKFVPTSDVFLSDVEYMRRLNTRKGKNANFKHK
jgi:hypothetical protein